MLQASIQRLESLVSMLLSRSTNNRAVWQNQTVWHIDFDNGNDGNTGLTQATALLTLGELFNRVGRDFNPKQSLDIYLYGDNKPTDPWDAEWQFNVPRGPISPYPGPTNYALIQARVHAMTPEVYYTGSMTAVQTMDPSINRPYVITDTNAIGANQTPPVPPPNNTTYWYNSTIDWFGNVRGNNHSEQRLRITSGPRAGAVAWTSAGNLGALFGGGTNGAIRTSNWCIPVPFAYTANYAAVGVTPVVPQVGDPFVVEKLQLLYLDRLISKGNGDFGGSGLAFNGFQFRLVNGGDSQNPSNQCPIVVDGGSLAFVVCSFDFDVIIANNSGVFAAFSYFVNSNGIDGIFATGAGVCYVDAGNYHLSLGVTANATMQIDADAFVETGAIYALNGGQVWMQQVQVHDFPGHARKAGVITTGGTGTGGAFGTAYFFPQGFYGDTRLWGQDQTGSRPYGISAFDGGRFLWDPTLTAAQLLARITIAGVQKDFNIGLSYQHGDQAVGIDPVTKLPTTLRDCTYDNLFNKTIAQGGFGGRAIDPETYALMAIFTDPVAH